MDIHVYKAAMCNECKCSFAVTTDSLNGFVPIHTCLPKIKNEQLIKLLNWATDHDTGVSSEVLLRHMIGLYPGFWRHSSPSDAYDRGRCIRLLNIIPEWWDRLDEMSEFGDWKEQIKLIREEK